MKMIQGIQLVAGSNEELLPDFLPDFPYIATRAEVDKYINPVIPWHWHRAVEIFYMESGTLEYTTPGGTWLFPAGSGGFVNSSVLHSSKLIPSGEPCIQMLHLFEPNLLSGEEGSRIEQKYIRPLTTANEIEIILLSKEDPVQADLLNKIRSAFHLSQQEWGYELKLRQCLSEIWLSFYEMAHPMLQDKQKKSEEDQRVKEMMLYIHGHYSEMISVEEIAKAAHVSKRACFRLFRQNLHMSPVDYMTQYRLRKAHHMLIDTEESIAQIANLCGLGSGSYFGKLFREYYGDTPSHYRKENKRYSG